MMDLNKVELIGRLTTDPTQGVSERQMPNAVFRLQTERVRKDRSTGATKREVSLHTIFAVGKLAEVILKYLRQGDRLYVEGTLRGREHAQPNGEKVLKTGIVAENIIMLGGGKKKEPEQKSDEVVMEEVDVPGEG